MIFSIIPLWFVLTVIKEKIIKWLKRKKLLSKGIISINNWYSINGVKGKITYIGKNSVHLEGLNGSMAHIPIESICDGIVISIREIKEEVK